MKQVFSRLFVVEVCTILKISGFFTCIEHCAVDGFAYNVLESFSIFQMVSLLLVKGANVKAKDRRERISLHLAAYMGMLTSPLTAKSNMLT